MFRKLVIIAACALSAACASVSGGREPLITDRPDFTESAETVAPKSVQVEAGKTYTREGDVKSMSFGEVLVRTGVTPRSELRIAANSYVVEKVAGITTQGVEDASIGTKISLLKGPDKPSIRPSISFIAATSIPTGSSVLRSNKLLPEVKLLGAWGISERLAFASNLNWAAGDNGGTLYSEYSATGSFAYSFTERVGGYAEYFGFVERINGWEKRHYMNGGLTFLFSPNLQIDARAGIGPHTSTHDFFAGVGLARRW